MISVFTARRYASAVYAVVVCPSVCPSQAGVVSKRLDELSWLLACKAFYHISHTLLDRIRRFLYLQKLACLPLELCPKLRT